MPRKVFTGIRNHSLIKPVKLSKAIDSVTTDVGAPHDFGATRRLDDERWRKEQEILRRAAVELAKRRARQEVAAMSQLTTVAEHKRLETITEFLEDPSREVRNQAARALYQVNPEFAATFFNSALREAPKARRRTIGAALAGSGLVSDAIQALNSGRQKNAYSTISLLFLVAKAGEVQPLLKLLEDHPSIELRLALIELLALSGEASILPALKRLAVKRILPAEVRSAVMEAIYQLGAQSRASAVKGL
ncbi:MAG: HEAT repeat domain-containing protein [Pyrinomonadaceae bacterium]